MARTQYSPQLLRDFFTKPVDFGDSDSLRSALEKGILLRVIIISLFLLTSVSSVLFEPSHVAENRLFFIAIALTYALSLGNAYLLRRTKNTSLQQFAYGQLLVDVFLATVTSFVSESFTVLSLFLLIVVSAAFLVGRHGAVIIAAAAGLAYSLVTSEMLIRKPEHLSKPEWTDIFAVYSSLVIVALVSSYIARRLELAKNALTRQEQSFSEFHQQQQQLINGLSEGVIMLDLESTITGINEAARAIIGLANLEANHLVGQQIQKALSLSGSSEILSALKRVDTESEVSSELTLKRPDTNEDVHLSYNITTLNDRSGKAAGRVLRLSDISDYHDIREQLHMHERMTALLAETHPETSNGFRSPAAHEMVGSSEAMLGVFTLVGRIAPSDASVLITGESGTGKELIARSIHYRSNRANRKFVAVNCGAIPENLLESEFFGHKKGAFTGAVADKPGLFQEAEGGTLFLDEVGELPLLLQTKLLRALQERVVRSVGDTKDVAVNVRVVAATNRELKREILAGRFREDLYYRLNVLSVEIPALRQRKEDIPHLVSHFLQAAALEGDFGVPQISPEALKMLMSYDFPGNIRELENIIARALVFGGGAILPSHLPEELRRANGKTRSAASDLHSKGSQNWDLPLDLEEELSVIERALLVKALEASNGVKKNAAELLGLNFRSFRYRLKKYGLQDANDADS